MSAPMFDGTTFLNVDLDVYSKASLAPLVAALGEKVFVLHEGREGRRYGAHLELPGSPKNADVAIRGLAALIRKLPRSKRRLWDTASVRDFNIGIQAEHKPRCYELALAAETIRTVADLKARVVVTVYAAEVPEGGSLQRVRQRRRRPATG